MKGTWPAVGTALCRGNVSGCGMRLRSLCCGCACSCSGLCVSVISLICIVTGCCCCCCSNCAALRFKLRCGFHLHRLTAAAGLHYASSSSCVPSCVRHTYTRTCPCVIRVYPGFATYVIMFLAWRGGVKTPQRLLHQTRCEVVPVCAHVGTRPAQRACTFQRCLQMLALSASPSLWKGLPATPGVSV
jgi:hypothetical protein